MNANVVKGKKKKNKEEQEEEREEKRTGVLHCGLITHSLHHTIPLHPKRGGKGGRIMGFIPGGMPGTMPGTMPGGTMPGAGGEGEKKEKKSENKGKEEEERKQRKTMKGGRRTSCIDILQRHKISLFHSPIMPGPAVSMSWVVIIEGTCGACSSSALRSAWSVESKSTLCVCVYILSVHLTKIKTHKSRTHSVRTLVMYSFMTWMK